MSIQYQVKVLDESYGLAAWLDRWLRLRYTVALNRMTAAEVDLPANDPKIPDCSLMSRLLIVREGEPVWGGLLQAESWEIAATANGTVESPYALDALDHCLYLEWRTILPPPGEEFDTRSGAADDLAKAYVRHHAGPLAAAERQFPDLSIQADTGAVASVTKPWRGGTVLEHVQRVATEQQFYWRMVPGAKGVEFQTAYPLWGKDRTKGNGVNPELVFAFDRKNVRQISYKRDLSGHYNYVYLQGAGTPPDELKEEVSDATAVSAWKRRELWNPATNHVTPEGLQAEGTRVLQENRVYEVMSVVPTTGSISLNNLGDKVTVFERRYGRTFRFDAIIMALDVEVGRDGVERITPAELVAA